MNRSTKEAGSTRTIESLAGITAAGLGSRWTTDQDKLNQWVGGYHGTLKKKILAV
jgi:hypothetical protein